MHAVSHVIALHAAVFYLSIPNFLYHQYFESELHCVNHCTSRE